MIPKIIHYCWLSGDKFPPLFKKCINSWKKQLPGWEFRLWDKSCLEEINEPWVHEAYEAKVYSHASDYIRLYAVYKYGGFYLDCDVEVLKDFSPLIELNYVLSLENSNSGYIEAAIFGAHAGNPYLKKCMERYHNRHFIKDDGSYDYSFIIPDIMMQCIGEYGYFLQDSLAQRTIVPVSLTSYQMIPTLSTILEVAGVHSRCE